MNCDAPCHPLPSVAIGQIWGRFRAIPCDTLKNIGAIGVAIPCSAMGGGVGVVGLLRPNHPRSSEELKKAAAVPEEKISGVPAGAANFPAAVFLAGKCPNLGSDRISRCPKSRNHLPAASEFAGKPFQQSEVIQEPLPLKPGVLVKKIGRFSKTQKRIY